MSAPNASHMDQRVRELEERLSFQQRTIDELNQVVLDHSRLLQQLSLELARFGELLSRLSDMSGGGDLPHEKPPHY